MTNMSLLFSRTAIIPVWLLVFGLFMLLGSPMTFAIGLVLLLVAGAALTLMLLPWKEPLPTVATMTMPDPPLATLSSADFVPNSWPNSGFRNGRQRGSKGR